MIKNQAIKDLSEVKTKDQDIYCKILDSDHGYRYCDSHYPLV